MVSKANKPHLTPYKRIQFYYYMLQCVSLDFHLPLEKHKHVPPHQFFHTTYIEFIG